jgi:hypothetical protein
MPRYAINRGLLALSLLAAGLAPPASNSPVVATSCVGGVTSIELVEHAAYDASFRNDAGVAADEIQVSIPYGRRRVATFDVKQSFPPHTVVPVHLHKNLAGGLYAYETDQNTCNVQYVHFVDGTQWGDPRS